MRFSWSSRLAALGVLLALAVGAGRAEAQTVRGTVSDSASGKPLEGALVTVIGTAKRTVSSGNGQFTLENLTAGKITLRVSMIGYAPQVRALALLPGDEATADFKLDVKAVELEELVSVGYGTVTRENLATAVSSVSSEDISGQANASSDAALQGRAPGVQVVQNAGNPGNAVTVKVRGTASFSASSQPLYVVDGVPVVSEDLSQMSFGGQGIRAITGLSPDDIASIDVLKDAASASIYGSRGSNGVVLITTKRGQTGRAQVSFNAFYGTQAPSKTVDLLTGTQYMTYMNEAAENDGYGADYFGVVGVDDTVNTNWQDAIYRRAPISSAELAVSGGTDQIRYRVAGTWFDQDGIALSSGYRRIGTRANLDFVATPRLNFSVGLAVSGERNQRIQNDDNLEGVTTNAIADEPLYPVRQPNGAFTTTADGIAYPNPVAIAHFNEAFARTTTVIGNVEGRYSFTPSLTFTGRVGVNLYTLREQQYRSPLVEGTEAAGLGGIAEQAYSTGNKYVFDGFFSWNRLLSGNDLSVTAGSSVELNRSDRNYLRGENLSDPSVKQVNNSNKVTSFGGTFAEDNLVSFFGRANYSIADKYLLGVTFRRDEASVFGPGNRAGFFPGASLAWVASREGFLANNGTISLFKIRTSVGRTGNQALSAYPWQGTWCSANYGDESGYYPCKLANTKLGWEKTTQVNLGADLELWNGRVTFTGDWYNKNTSDLLLDRPLAGNSGYTTFIANIGELRNRGVELGLTTVLAQPARADGLRWVTTLNLSFNKNEVTALYDDQPFSTGYYEMNRVEVGHPLGAFHGYKFTGVDPATGDALYKDVDGDGQLTSADRTFIGDPWPDYTGGFTSTWSWKRFDLTTFFQFSKGNDVFNAMRVFSDDGGYNYDNKFADVMDRWQQPGDKTDQPRASFDGLSDARRVSSRWLEDGSYLRLQDLTLGYQLPDQLAASAGFASARLYVRAQNLWTTTKYTGYNPEVNSNGSSSGQTAQIATDFYAYPLARTWTFGIQAGW